MTGTMTKVYPLRCLWMTPHGTNRGLVKVQAMDGHLYEVGIADRKPMPLTIGNTIAGIGFGWDGDSCNLTLKDGRVAVIPFQYISEMDEELDDHLIIE